MINPITTPLRTTGSTSYLPAEALVSFVACVSDDDVLRSNLLASPCLEPGSPHEVVLVRNCPTAADGLNLGLERARHEMVVCMHQDVHLPRGWDQRVLQKLEVATRKFGPIGVAGVYGVSSLRVDWP